MDLTLLSIDEQKLPIYLQMRCMPLCENPPVARRTRYRRGSGRNGAFSHYVAVVASPSVSKKIFHRHQRCRTTGNSGSGVFDAGQKCLLGIISLKIYQTPSSGVPENEQNDIAKYFVPASIIRTFIPPEYRF